MIDSANEFIRLRMSDNPNEYQRAAVEEAGVDVWFDLIKNHPEMKVWVASNKTVPLEVLNILAIDDDPEIRFTVAMKRKLSMELFETLAHDLDESVRACIARNKKTPQFVLEKLSLDPVIMVRDIAIKRINEIKK